MRSLVRCSSDYQCILTVLSATNRQAAVSVHRPSDLHAVALALNTRPRKTLSWRTPAEALNEVLRSAHRSGVATTS